MRTVVLLSFLVLWAYAAHPDTVPKEVRELEGEALVEYINKQGKWKAETHSRFAGKSTEELKQFLGALKKPAHMRRRGTQAEDIKLDNAPISFDALEKWPHCAKIIGQIQDQSACGSCWAVSSTSAMSDRLCIASNGKIQTQLSALDLMACCSWCGYQCQETKKHKCPDAPKNDFKCVKKCQNQYSTETYKTDHYYGKKVTTFTNQNEAAIAELINNGPFVAAFSVYEDFYQYKGGIYEYQAGKLVGGHAVRVVGYGEEDGVKYWKVANSWDWYWGEGGYFRIRRGTNECGFESEITSGTVDVERSLKDK